MQLVSYKKYKDLLLVFDLVAGKKRSKRSLTMKDIFKRIQEKHLTDISPGMINDTISRRKRWIEVRTTLSSRG